MSLQELRNEIDMLQGNVNRMMVPDDAKEIDEMYSHANRRLAIIHAENAGRVHREEENKE